VRLGTPRFPAVVSACGFTASVFAYIGSFAGTLVDDFSLVCPAGYRMGCTFCLDPRFSVSLVKNINISLERGRTT
jgi:hypothetical protein